MLPLMISFLLAFHLLALNLASAGPLLCCWLQWRRSAADGAYGVAGKRLARASIAALLVGILLGFVLLACAWLDTNRAYWQALSRLPTDAYLYAAAEIIFSLICLVAYVALWDRWSSRPWLHGLLALLSSSNLLYHFPPLMSAIAEVAARPELVLQDTIDRPQVLALMGRPEVLSMTVHFVVASLAVGGIVVMHIGTRLADGADETDERSAAPSAASSAAALVVLGARVALATSALQMLIGFWVVLQSTHTGRLAMMGGDWLATLLLIAGFVSVFALLQALAPIACGSAAARLVWRSSWLLLIVVLLMTGLLVRTRRMSMGPGVATMAQRRAIGDSAGATRTAVASQVTAAALGGVWRC